MIPPFLSRVVTGKVMGGGSCDLNINVTSA